MDAGEDAGEVDGPPKVEEVGEAELLTALLPALVAAVELQPARATAISTIAVAVDCLITRLFPSPVARCRTV